MIKQLIKQPTIHIDADEAAIKSKKHLALALTTVIVSLAVLAMGGAF